MTAAPAARHGVAVVGCGYWGPNLVRNLSTNPRAEVIGVADLSEPRRKEMARLHRVPVTADYKSLLADGRVEIVFLATPAATHAALVLEALAAGKHVFCEKPLSLNLSDGRKVAAALAKTPGRVFVVGHTFLYHRSVEYCRNLIASGELGEVQYAVSTRANLGIFQTTLNCVWDLAPHDVSIANFLLGETPTEACCIGSAHVTPGVEDVAFAGLRYPSGALVHMHLSWLAPAKTRETVIVGSKKMLIYDDMNAESPVQIYAKGVEKIPHYADFAEFKFHYRFGDLLCPRIEMKEPVGCLVDHILDCLGGETPRTGIQNALETVAAMEAMDRSMKNGGGFVPIEKP